MVAQLHLDADESPLLQLRSVSKTFTANPALDRLTLAIQLGEVHAVIGQNGSGKSTLVKLLAGYHQPDPGASASMAGEPFELGSAKSAAAAGIRFVHQDLGLVDALSVSDNFHLAHGSSSLRRLKRGHERADAEQALKALGCSIDPSALVGSLSETERTAVALARALDEATGVRLLVLDEATGSLPRAEADRLFAALQKVARNGTAVLFISHFLDEVLTIAHRVTVLRDGQHIATTSIDQVSHDGLVEMMLGRKLMLPEKTPEFVGERSDDASGGLVVKGLTGKILFGLDIQVRPGQVMGISGLTGSGREELGGLVAGRLPRAGAITVNGNTVAPGDPRAAIDTGIGYVPPDRMNDALFPLASVRENLTLAALHQFWNKGRLDKRREIEEAERWINLLDVRPNATERPISTLSGGNQQKVVMARWLRLNLPVMVLDEPTHGVDVGSKADIHRLISEAAAAGSTVLLCSNDVDELVRLATEVVVLRRGRKGAVLRGKEISVDRIEFEQLAVAEQVNAQGMASS
jgi:ribose transport system ATP-binding protein